MAPSSNTRGRRNQQQAARNEASNPEGSEQTSPMQLAQQQDFINAPNLSPKANVEAEYDRLISQLENSEKRRSSRRSDRRRSRSRSHDRRYSAGNRRDGGRRGRRGSARGRNRGRHSRRSHSGRNHSNSHANSGQRGSRNNMSTPGASATGSRAVTTTQDSYADFSKYLQSESCKAKREQWALRSDVDKSRAPSRLPANASSDKKLEQLHENFMRTYGASFRDGYESSKQAWRTLGDPQQSQVEDMMAVAGVSGVHPFDVDNMPDSIEARKIELDTGLTARQRAVNWLYAEPAQKTKNRGAPLFPREIDYRTGKYVVKANFDIRMGCNPPRCRIKGLQNRRIPTKDFSSAINFLLRSHDSSRVPGTDDPHIQAVHLTRRACTEMVIYVEALNECMLAVSNIIAGLPEEMWFAPVLLRWDTIQAYLEDSLNGLNSASRMYSHKLVCRSGKRFKKLMEDRQSSLPLPQTFAKVDPTDFMPGRDFRFMAEGPGRLKSKQNKKVLSPKIELQGRTDEQAKEDKQHE